MIPKEFELERVYQKRIDHAASGAAIEDVTDDPVDVGKTLIVQAVAVIDQTTAFTKLRIGYKRGSLFHGFFEQDTAALNTTYNLDVPMILIEGDMVCAQLVGATAADKVIIEIQGYEGRMIKNAV